MAYVRWRGWRLWNPRSKVRFASAFEVFCNVLKSLFNTVLGTSRCMEGSSGQKPVLRACSGDAAGRGGRGTAEALDEPLQPVLPAPLAGEAAHQHVRGCHPGGDGCSAQTIRDSSGSGQTRQTIITGTLQPIRPGVPPVRAFRKDAARTGRCVLNLETTEPCSIRL